MTTQADHLKESQPNYQQSSIQTNVEDKPIPGPKSVGPEYTYEPDWDRPLNPSLKLGRFLADLVRKPTHWIRENIVEANRGPKYYWYHKRFDSPLPIDECYIDDFACIYEANQEFRRTRLVDKYTLELLRYRRDNCNFWHMGNKGITYAPHEDCQEITDTYNREEINYFIKYGDLHFNDTVLHAYNKQKHRMIMERRKALQESQGQKSEAGH